MHAVGTIASGSVAAACSAGRFAAARMTVDLIVNPAAGPVTGGLARGDRLAFVSARLRALGVRDVRPTQTCGIGDAARAALEARRLGSDRVVVWGGDGTLNIRDGGEVVSPIAYVGAQASSAGDVTIDKTGSFGTPSTWRGESLYIGGDAIDAVSSLIVGRILTRGSRAAAASVSPLSTR